MSIEFYCLCVQCGMLLLTLSEGHFVLSSKGREQLKRTPVRSRLVLYFSLLDQPDLLRMVSRKIEKKMGPWYYSAAEVQSRTEVRT